MEDFVEKLFNINGIKFGKFVLKSGVISPVYVDLRLVVSDPPLMATVAELLWQLTSRYDIKNHCVVGVPYTAIPIATLIAAAHNVPMLLVRKEAKDYGTMKMVEGIYHEGDHCLIVEDVITSGSSVFQTVELLRKEGLIVTDVIAIVDRQQGGKQNLASHGIKLHSIYTLTEITELLFKLGMITEEILVDIKNFISGSVIIKEPCIKSKREHMSYSARSATCQHALSKNLLNLMEDKRTNLCLSADVSKCSHILQMAEQLGPYICMMKLHTDILEDFSLEFIEKLKILSQKHKFILFEDRKFSDIGNTVAQQYSGGIHKISEWAQLVTVHSLPGPGVITALKKVANNTTQACILVAEMSSKGSLASGEYTKATLKMAIDNQEFVIGFICQSSISDEPNFIHMTPGVRLLSHGDGLGQQYWSPEDAISLKKTDIIIVGRGIYESPNPIEEAKVYQQLAFEAYEKRIKQ